MLDLVPDMFWAIDSKFLEPACGHGNFLVEILARKIALIPSSKPTAVEEDFEFSLLIALSSIYAVDISEENVQEARHRLFEVVMASTAFNGGKNSTDFAAAVNAILASNLKVGDSLNDATTILFIEYEPVEKHSFRRTPFYLEEPEMDIFYQPPMPMASVHYLDLGK